MKGSGRSRKGRRKAQGKAVEEVKERQWKGEAAACERKGGGRRRETPVARETGEAGAVDPDGQRLEAGHQRVQPHVELLAWAVQETVRETVQGGSCKQVHA